MDGITPGLHRRFEHRFFIHVFWDNKQKMYLAALVTDDLMLAPTACGATDVQALMELAEVLAIQNIHDAMHPTEEETPNHDVSRSQ